MEDMTINRIARIKPFSRMRRILPEPIGGIGGLLTVDDGPWTTDD
jgi:hypothetical protein